MLALAATVGYFAFPQTTASVVMTEVGAEHQDFTPPEIEKGDQVFHYEGSFKGNAGPVGTSIGGDIKATVDFEEGVIVAEVSGDEVEEGYFEGTLDQYTGEVSGEGAVNVFGMTGQPVEFEGGAHPEAVEAEGQWYGVGEIDGKGSWHAEMTEVSRCRGSARDSTDELRHASCFSIKSYLIRTSLELK